MASNSAVVLSDVHIGNGAPTTWYQSSVHEPYLTAALQWVVDNRAEVQELILLGDVFDIWTYPPSVRPPSVADIIAANPNTLGPGGALARAVAAVGRTTYLLGNHDGTLTRQDIKTFQDAVGPVQPVEEIHILTGATGARTLFSHGHLWTMFNAPDTTSPWNTLPVGHFVTRAFAYQMANTLKPGQTVADLPNMGAPDGFNLLQFLRSLRPTLDPDIAGLLLDYCSTAASMPESLPVVLPDGSTTTISDAKRIFANLFTRWVNAEHGSVLNAARAAMADGSGDYLAWFAQRAAIQHSADLIVLGHTHTPIAGLTISPINYINNGFECASIPDTPPKEFTFTVVDLDTASAEIYQVQKGTYKIAPAEVGPLSSAILPPAKDYSCYVRITNTSSQTLTRTSLSNDAGAWVVPPPDSIAPGQRVDAWLQDDPGLEGSEGKVTYSNGSNKLSFSFSCPTTWWNSISGPSFIARSGSGDWQGRNLVPKLGYPLQVRFTVS